MQRGVHHCMMLLQELHRSYGVNISNGDKLGWETLKIEPRRYLFTFDSHPFFPKIFWYRKQGIKNKKKQLCKVLHQKSVHEKVVCKWRHTYLFKVSSAILNDLYYFQVLEEHE